MKKKSIFTLVFTTFLVFYFNGSSIAIAANNEEEYTVIESTIDGLERYSIQGDVSDKKLAEIKLNEFLEEKFDVNKNNVNNITPFGLSCTDHTSSDKKEGSDSRSSYAKVTNYAKAVWKDTFWTCQASTSGYTTGYWSGSTPYYADKMVFNQSYSVSSGTLTVTGGWGSGASVSYNPSKSEGSWKSEPITSTFNETVSKPNMVFSSGTALYSVTFSDTVDIYIPGNTYRPSASVYLN